MEFSFAAPGNAAIENNGMLAIENGPSADPCIFYDFQNIEFSVQTD